MTERPAYLPGYLTPQQIEAVLNRAWPLLIIAGPGSGKTEVISWRVTHLIQAGAARPDKLLVTTFTNKAALELKDRIQRNLERTGFRQSVEQIHAGTIHSLCADILRGYQSHSPLPRGFRILTEHGQLLFVHSHRVKLGLKAVVKGYPEDFYSDVLKMFNLATEELVTADGLLGWCQKQLREAEARAAEAAKGKSKTKAKKASDEVELWRDQALITESYRAYCELLREHSLVDFAFLQRHTLDLLDAHPDIVAELRDRYREILVDEYQDTNAAQERIIKHLAGAGEHLTVVGDDDQSIYRFRGATVQNILAFSQRYPGAQVVRLTQNFRSREPIVKHSLSVIVNNPARYSKELFTLRGTGSDVLLVHEEFVAEEAATLAGLLSRLYDAGKIRRWADVALLLRSVKSYANDYVAAFQARGIPAYVVGDGTFFDREDIEQLYGLFNFLGGTKYGWDTNVRCSLIDLDTSTWMALEAYPGNLVDITDDAGLRQIGIAHAGDRHRLLELLELKRRVQAKEHTSLLDVFYDLLAITGYATRCERLGHIEPLMNLGVLSQLIAAFDEFAGTRNFYPFQDYLQLLKRAGVDPAIIPPEDAVQVMTIHQAKGLEFPVVVVGSVMEERLPARRRKDRYPIPLELRASGPLEPGVVDPHLVDERRLFYVAATRAQELLILGTADKINKRGGGPSQFLVEMFGEDLKAVANDSEAYVQEVESHPVQRRSPRERLSFSQLSYYLQCPVRYKFAVVCSLEVAKPDPVDFGANVHRALLAIHDRARTGQPVPEDEVDGIVEQVWITAPSADPAQDQRARKAAIAQIKQYVSKYAEALSRTVQAEAAFSFGLDEHVLLGKIDLIRQAEEGVEIVDFKTGKSTLTALEQVDTQLDLYALGAESNLGQKVVRQTVHFLGDDKVYSWNWSPQKAASSQARLGEIAGRIAQRQFEPRLEYCRHCSEFRRICPYAQPVKEAP